MHFQRSVGQPQQPQRWLTRDLPTLCDSSRARVRPVHARPLASPKPTQLHDANAVTPPLSIAVRTAPPQHAGTAAVRSQLSPTRGRSVPNTSKNIMIDIAPSSRCRQIRCPTPTHTCHVARAPTQQQSPRQPSAPRTSTRFPPLPPFCPPPVSLSSSLRPPARGNRAASNGKNGFHAPPCAVPSSHLLDFTSTA